jgi:hypothetical protein
MLGSGADALTVGLSSGTSGNRGVFLVSRAERLRWAGILLGRALPGHLLKRLLSPWTPPLGSPSSCAPTATSTPP